MRECGGATAGRLACARVLCMGRVLKLKRASDGSRREDLVKVIGLERALPAVWDVAAELRPGGPQG